MRILVLGDFHGQAGAAADAPGHIRMVDIDTFDHVMAALRPSLALAGDESDAASEPLVFGSLDDFHPDRLARQDPVLKRLQALKGQLKDPAGFALAAAALGTPAGGAVSAAGDSAVASGAVESDAETLRRLLGAKPETVGASAAAQAPFVDELIRRTVAPYVLAPAPDAGPYLAAADAAAGDRLRRLLHDPGFQALEAAWRSLHGLVSQVETGEDVQVGLLSVGLDGLTIALGAADDDPERSPLYRLLRDAGASGADAFPWGLIVADFAFGPDPQELQRLARLGAICQRLGMHLVAGARPMLVGCPDLLTHPDPRLWGPLPPEASRRWQDLRSGATANAIALALPRVLLRLPYGQSADPCDLFAFEEMPTPPRHDSFLWGNPAFLCALVLAQAHRDGEDPPRYADIDDLPAYVFRAGDEMRMQACAEVYLSEAAGESIREAGCIPVLSYQRRNAVRLGPLQTIVKGP